MSKLKSSTLILGVFFMSFLIGYLVFAWTEPTDVPPGDNVDAPLNVGPTGQLKIGDLTISGGVTTPVFYDSADSSYFVDPEGQAVTDYSAILKGSVGIGTIDPGTNKLEVVGGPIKATGGLIIETRTDDPASPADGQIWLRTDL